MEENKQNTLLLTVIAIATLLVAVIGATFAYFTANASDTSTKALTVNAGSILISWFDSEDKPIKNEVVLNYDTTKGFQPQLVTDEALAVKTFTITATNSTGDYTSSDNYGNVNYAQLPRINFSVDLVYSSSFSNESLSYTFDLNNPTGVTFDKSPKQYITNDESVENNKNYPTGEELNAKIASGDITGFNFVTTSPELTSAGATNSQHFLLPGAVLSSTTDKTAADYYTTKYYTFNSIDKTGRGVENYAVQLGTGSFNFVTPTGNVSTGSATFILKIWYYDNNEDQDYDKGAEFTGYVYVRGLDSLNQLPTTISSGN